MAGPAASSGQPPVLAALQAVNLNLAPDCQVGEEERGAGREWASLLLSSLGRGVMLEVSVVVLRFKFPVS